MKSLFIPLKSEHYNNFVSGNKKTEYRINGPRWNERTCKVGRPVVISKGYGKKNRRSGVITGFRCVMAASSSCSFEVLKSCYPEMEGYYRIAEIDIQLDTENCKEFKEGV